MDPNTLFLGDFREPMSETYTLDPECFAQMKKGGIFVHNTRRWDQPVDISTHVAAQNAYGWTLQDEAYIPYGSSHSALILRNIQFSIPKDLFRPLHKSPPDGSQENQKVQ